MEEGAEFKKPTFDSKNNKNEEDKIVDEKDEVETKQEPTPPKTPSLNYKVPEWEPSKIKWKFQLDVLKGGTVIESIPIHEKGHYTIGRIPTCDIIMDHQSVSRQHAIIQHRSDGAVFIFDLNSTHGSKINKKQIPPNTYVPYRVGDLAKFGESTRLFILSAPDYDDTEERQAREMDNIQKKIDRNNKIVEKIQLFQAKKRKEETTGNEVEEDSSVTSEDISEIFRPKDDEFLTEIPETDPDEEEKRLELIKKKIEAYYEEDEDDDFYDRAKKTSSLRKRHVHTYDELVKQKQKMDKEVEDLLSDIAKVKSKQTSSSNDKEDDLDSFMESLSNNMQKEKLNKLETKLKELEKERQKIGKLMEVAKPALSGLGKRSHESTKPSDKPLAPLTMEEIKTVPIAKPVPQEQPVKKENKPPEKPKEDQKQQKEQKNTKPPAKKKKVEVDEIDDWVPPSDQSGDGTTVLNKLYGY